MITESNFQSAEKVKSAVYFSSFIRHFYGHSKAQDFLKSYCYLRNLDNLNDQAADPEEAKDTLEAELRKLDDSQHIPIEFMASLQRKYGKSIADYFKDNIEGFLTDNFIMRTGKPLREADLRKRNKKHYLPGFQITSLIIFEEEFEYGPDFEKIGNTYIQYDALRDISEDFPHNLILFSQEELTPFCKDHMLPLSAFYAAKKEEVLKRILEDAKGMFDSNAPLWFKSTFSLYFLSRYSKLKNHQFDYKDKVPLTV